MATAKSRRRSANVKQTDRVLKEYVCLAHGDFEAYTPVCPQGCDTVERRFVSPPSIGGQSRNIDKTLDTLAADFNMTDMRNDMGSVMNSMRRGTDNFAPKWGAMGEQVAPAIGNVPPTNMVQDMKDAAVIPEGIRAVPLSSKHIDRTPLNAVRAAE